MVDDWTDWFWWLEKADQAITQQFTSRREYALEITGASKRQERLELQRETNSEIGEEHEDEGCNGGVEHEHGHQPVTIEHSNEPCPHPGCTETPKAICGFCNGSTVEPDGTTPCKHCKGRGAIQTGPTPLHEHIGPAVPYTPQDHKVADLKDGWSIKRCRTFGDLKYEGMMMNHCIQEDADSGAECESCEGSGQCQYDSNRYQDAEPGNGQQYCEECGGEGEQDCDECGGEGRQDCPNCFEITNHQERCARCGGDGEIRDGAGNSELCGRCDGKGNITRHRQQSTGEVDCETCGGTGHDEHDEDKECEDCEGNGKVQCPECEGESKLDCDECDGAGLRACRYCEGEGTQECSECRGTGTCGTCDGEGNQETGAGASNYYQPFSQSEADRFSRAPGGPNSLRDADNIPHVSFLGHNEHINNVFGRGDKMPSPENQHRILQYLHGKIGDGPCDTCQGTGKTPKIMQHDEQYPCRTCEGSGKATATVGWATRGTQSYTKGDIEGILNGTHNRPDTLLLAQSKDEPNSVHTFEDVGAARNFAGGHAYVRTPEGQRNGTASETHNLYAIPSIAVGKDSMIYNPAGSKWELKSGRGSRIPLETAGAQIPWEAIHGIKVPCRACDASGYNEDSGGYPKTCNHCGGDGRVLDHGNADTIAKLPDFAKALLPKVAQSPSPRYICPRCQDSVGQPGETCASCKRLIGGFVDSDATLPERIDGAVGDPGYSWERSSSDIGDEITGWKFTAVDEHLATIPPEALAFAQSLSMDALVAAYCYNQHATGVHARYDGFRSCPWCWADRRQQRKNEEDLDTKPKTSGDENFNMSKHAQSDDVHRRAEELAKNMWQNRNRSMGPKIDGYGVWSGFYCSEHDDNHPEMRIPLYADEKHRWEQDPQSYCWHELIRSCSPEDSPEWLGVQKSTEASKTAELIPFPPGKDGDVDEDTWLPPFSEGELHKQFTPSQRTRYRRDG